MSSKLLLETPLGKLEVESDIWYEIRTITFKKGTLTISEVNISVFDYELILQHELYPGTVRSLEKCLLDEAHSFKRKDAKKIAKKIADEFIHGRKPFNFGGIHIVLGDSAFIWSIAVTPSYEHRNRESFNFELVPNGDESKKHTWEIKVDADDDILVSAIKYVCLSAESIHSEKDFENFILMMSVTDV